VAGDYNIVSYFIKNDGDDTLFLTGNPIVAISGTNASDFTMQSQPSASFVLPLDSIPFEIKFDPSAAGNRTATVSISNDDDNEDPYNFDIKGWGCDLVAQITVDKNVSCFGFADGQLTASQTGGTSPFGYAWSNSGTVASITNLLANSYAVTITDTKGCEDTLSETVSQPTQLSASSVVTDVSCYNGSNGQINVTINGGTSPYNSIWSDNSTNEDLMNMAAGIYTDTITDKNGCQIIKTDTIEQPDQVDAGVITYTYSTSTPTAICYNTAPGTINNQTSASGGSTTLDYTWESSTDGVNFSAASGTNNGATYTPGALNQDTWFRRIATDNSCSQSDYSNTIKIRVLNNFIVGSIDGSSSLCQYETSGTLSELSAASGGGESFSYIWQVSKNNSSWSTISGATNNTYEPGMMNETSWFRRIDISDSNCGLDTTNTILVQVSPKPNADFAFTSGCKGEIVYFIDSTTLDSGQISSYRWDMDDLSGYHTVQNPLHVFKSSGNYNVELIVTTDSNCTDTAIKQITVTPIPVAAFTSANICYGDSMVFNNGSTITSGTLTYVWIFGDGDSSTDNSPKHFYSSPGNYNVTLEVTSDNGCIDQITKIVKVYELPNVAFSANNECFGDQVSFTNQSSITNGNLAFTWDFGDGNTSNNTNPAYTYNADGTFSVKLIAESDFSCFDSVTKNITVYPEPVAGISVNNECVDKTFSFSNQSTISSGSMTYSWDFDDGASSTATNPTHKYAADGNYTITLIAASNFNCKDTTTTNITAYPLPQPAFATADVCDGSNITLTNNSSISSGSLSHAWNFGDGNNSTQTAPTHTYATYGTYTIKLVSTSGFGCMDSVTNNVTINPMPSVSFTANNECDGVALSFVNGSSVATGTNSYAWNFGDGSTSANSSPDHTYAADGNYTVKLIATTDKSCVDSFSKAVTVYPLPQPAFSVQDVCDGTSIMATNNSTINSGSMTYAWNLGDGNTSALTAPAHLYANYGTYPIKLVATSDNGCKDSTTNNVTVNPMPNVAFTADNQCFGTNISFVNGSSVATGSNSFLWSFGDGNNSTTVNPSHAYATEGNYTVKLIATTNEACIDSFSKAVSVYPMPSAGFNAANVCYGDTTMFVNSSTISSGNVTYKWSFGDGDSSMDMNPKHFYTSNGNYSVTLEVTSDNGCIDQITKIVKVYELPNVAFSANNECFGDQVSFTNQSSITNGNLAYTWNFGDGNTSNNTNPAYTYNADGTFSVKLIAESDFSCFDSVSKNITVYPEPVAGISVNNECVDKTFSFSNQSTISSGSMTYSWDFDDGASSTATNPTHKYAADGNYTITLIAASNFNCKDTTTTNITAYPLPQPAFATADVCDGSNITLTNNSSISSGSLSHAWNFGDGNNSTQTAPTHTYATYGTYTIKLVSTSGFGCMDSVTNNVTINPMPSVSFTANNECDGVALSFVNGSSVATGTNSYAWNFGDGSTSANSSPGHTYAADGNYTVKLIATTDKSCIDSFSKAVTVYPLPQPAFSVQDVCDGTSIMATNNSTINSGSMTYAWNLGDGNTSALTAPTHLYANYGTYAIKLVTTSDNGCKDSVTNNVTVNPMPNVSFTADNQCFGTNISFVNGSSVATGSNSFLWSFGDGNNSTTVNPSHAYATEGNYTVKLIATTNEACIDSFSKAVTVFPMPSAGFNAANVCYGDTTMFVNSSTISSGNVTYKWSFGDGDSSMDMNPKHFYTSNGNYSVTLEVTSDNGCIDQITKIVKVYELPNVAFSANNECYGDQVSFTNQSSITNGNLAYTWDFGDGNTSNNTNPAYTYNADGTFSVKLIAESDFSCFDSVSKNITVYPEPVAGISVNNECVDKTFSFSNQSTISSGSMTYSWDFDDGASSTATNPTHKYAADGNYTITLIAASNFNCKDTTTTNITAYPLPQPAFATADVCDGSNITLTNNSTISSGSLSHAWNFGDGNNSTQTAPTHTYATYGTYTIKLVSTSGFGCMDSVTNNVTINPMPSVSFTANNECDGVALSFVNGSSVATGTNSYAWNFGDGSTSANSSPDHTYAADGNYTVKLIATTDKSCVDSFSKAVTVYPLPQPAFSVQDVCDGTSIMATNNSTINSGSMTYAWNLGDGNTSALTAPTHLYANYGTYSIKLVATSDNGCKDSTTNNVSVNPMPFVAFTANNECDGVAIDFNNGSSVATGSNSYLWSYGDGNTSTTVNPSYQYGSYGTYTVKLVATTDKACMDSATNSVTVYRLPSTSLTVDDISCFGLGDGSIEVNSTQGSSPYTYSTDGINYQSHNIFQGLQKGNYKVYILDKYNCADTVSAAISEPPVLKMTIDKTNLSCYQDNSGSIQVNASGGVGGFTYSLNGGNYQTNKAFNNLSGGAYQVTLKDNNGCALTQGVTLTEPSSPVSILLTDKTDVSCKGTSSGNLTVDGTGGTGEILFNINGGTYQKQSLFEMLQANSYKVKATDQNGCSDSITVDILEPAKALSFNNIDIDDVLCFGENNGKITIHADGGWPSYTYGLFNKGTLQSDSMITNLIKGDYTVVVRDMNDCEITQKVTVSGPTAPLTAQLINLQNINCPDDNDGSFEVTGVGGTPTYEYSLDNVGYQSSGLFNNLSFGDYTLYVRDQNQCLFTYSASITPTTVKPTADFEAIINVGSVAFINKSKNATSYDWDFDDGNTSTAMSPSHTYDKPGSYNVVLIASNPCTSDTVTTVELTGKEMKIIETSINDLSSYTLKVYPNPTNDHLFIKVGDIRDKNISYNIFDINGKMISSESQLSPMQEIIQVDMSQVSRGVYILELTIGTDSGIFRIVKN
jgi:PKD repeat protein